ncbi:MAG: acetylornithine transaminase [Bacillus sp. (in: firmicutes)]|uniref:acetylornithine transaminase n=1 Tax=Bacillus marasmi TaxID=1926279 RepID=UPI0011CA34F5|nr:acetylornithine transaminase [Bacillus marasmi]
MSNLFQTYGRWEIEPASAQGSWMTDINGKKYLDFTSGIGVCNIGHRPEKVQQAVLEQINQYWHVSNLFTNSKQEEAATKLATAAGMDRVFFANSGAEANEGAIKLARKATGRTKIITFLNSFHGRTFATMSATGQDKIKHGFGPMLEKFVYVPYNDLEAVKAAIGDDVAAVMLEVVQGEGGIHVGDQSFLQGVEALCKEHGAQFIIDEIQTGIGRTGKPFAFQYFGLTPDIVTSAKGLGSGFPIGAVIGREHLSEYFGPGSHGSTFGGNPVSIAAAIATMNEIFHSELLEAVQEKGKYLVEQIQNNLSDVPFIKEVRGLGLMIGIECDQAVAPLLSELRNQGLILLQAGEKVIRLLPPLTVTNQEIDEAVKILAAVIKNSDAVKA